MWMKPPPRPNSKPDLTKIYTVFGKLSRQTQIALFEAWLDGDIIEAYYFGEWIEDGAPFWRGHFAYRVKPKQNKELEEAQKKVEEATKALEKATKLLNMIKQEV